MYETVLGSQCEKPLIANTSAIQDARQAENVAAFSKNLTRKSSPRSTGYSGPQVSSLDEAKLVAGRSLEGRRSLLILDNICQRDRFEALDAVKPPAIEIRKLRKRGQVTTTCLTRN
ncbi:MAG: hypothetical protein ACYTEK_25205 [Planctomycetota bacterium]|jgi:hypothetical protein